MSAGNNTSIQGLDYDDFFMLLDKLQVARFSIFAFVFVLGVWGNVMVIATVCRTKRLRNSSNYFIVNLAIADLGGLCISLPIDIISEITDWPFGAVVCRFVNPLKDLFLHVSFLTLTAIAVDRYWHTAHPFKAHLSFYKVKLILALIWLVDYLVVPLPMSFAMKIEKNPYNGFKVCMARWSPQLRKTSILVLAGLVFLSVFVTGSAYLGVGIAMFQQRKRIKMRAQGSGLQDKAFRRQLEKNANTVKLMIVIVLAFWLSVLPLTFLGVLLELKGLHLTPTQYVITLFIAIHLLFLQHCFNPVILYVLSKDMRAGFGACMQCCLGGKNQNGSQTSRRLSNSRSQQPRRSTITSPEQYIAANGVAKMYSIDKTNERGPTVQV